MLAIEVELLSGSYVATEYNDRSRAEWPPHPARLFSAMVAALHDRDPVNPEEKAALLWLEQQTAPQIDADLEVDETLGRREVYPVFVPVNDVTLVGDPESSLREAKLTLAELESNAQTPKTVAEVRKAQKCVEKAHNKLKDFVESQNQVPLKASKEDLKRSKTLIPDSRTRQERTFPTVIPAQPSVSFFWPEADPGIHLDAIRKLSHRVTRLGHSSSLVRCNVIDRQVTPTLVPCPSGEYVLRVVGPGQLERLGQAFAHHQAVNARVLPARPQRYGVPTEEKPDIPAGVFSEDWIIFERTAGHRPLSSRSADLAVALRRTLIEMHGTDDLPLILSGHDTRGDRAEQPHVAFVPLPWVGFEHADGSVMGLAIIMPRAMKKKDRMLLLRLLARWESERGDASDDYSTELCTPPGCGYPICMRLKRRELPTKVALNPVRWCKPSRRFITATPIALDRHPGNLRSNAAGTARKAADEAAATIADACEWIGLPRPVNVSISLAPLLPGAQHVRQFAPWPAKPGKIRRARVHADIVFEEKVKGPLLLGAGRYFGIGLCLPISEAWRQPMEGSQP